MATQNNRIILEARLELAGKYNWSGRVYDAQIALHPHLEPCVKRDIDKVLQGWDDYNDMVEYCRAARETGSKKSHTELVDEWLSKR